MANEQAVLIHLDGTTLPNDVYERNDLATLEDELIAVIERCGLGEFDGNEVGPTSTTLFLYGPDAGALFAGIEPILRGSALCQNARVIIRGADPDSQSTEVLLPLYSHPN